MKINIDNTTAADKSSGGRWWFTVECERAVEDLLFIQQDKKMYINEKKQLQSLIFKLYELDYYKEHKTALDAIGYTLLK